MGRIIFYFLFGLCLGVAGPASGMEDANAIVRKADAIRAPLGSYVFDATVVSFEGETQKSENQYRVSVKDLDRSLLEFTAPASEKGKSMLMLKDDIWVFLPRVNKPVRVPLKNRLLGEVAIGDMTRTNFSHDYDATFAGEETVGGKRALVFDLAAKSPRKPYARIRYWVEKDNYFPIQAEYFTASGRSLKTILFEDFESAAGNTRPMKAVFTDSINKNKKTVLTFQNMTLKELPDRMFSKEAMRTLD